MQPKGAPDHSLNRPLWDPSEPRGPRAFQEVWYLKVNDPAANRALWLRLTLLISGNGFKRVAETWAIYFQRGGAQEPAGGGAANGVRKVALKQTHDLKAFSPGADGMLRLGGCELGPDRTSGTVSSKGRSIRWEFSLARGHDASFNLIPGGLSRAKLVRNSAVTVAEDLRFSGFTEIDGERVEWRNAAGMQAHLSGARNGHSWVWGHCNLFVDGEGRPVPFLFEGLSARARIAGGIPTPRLSSFFFHYEGKPYAFNSVWDSLRAKSRASLSEWRFQADRGDLSFRGLLRAELKDFAGLAYEDTDGSLLYCANSKLSSLELHVYRRGKLETTLYGHGTAAFENVSRQKNPYVPILA